MINAYHFFYKYQAMYFYSHKIYHHADGLFLKRFAGNLWKLLRNLNSLQFIHTGVKRENFTKFVRKPEKSAVVLSHSTLITLLKNCKSVSEQIEVFQSYTKLSDEDIAKRIYLCNNIKNIFRSQFPNCTVHLVGSSISGLGTKGSDVDLSFQFSEIDISQNKAANTNTTPNVDVARGNIPVSDFPSLTVKQQLLFLQRILKQHEVAASSSIIPGRHPILNFKFDDLGCDLSINNWSAFQCTKLMKLCVELDYRVLPLYQLLSYWAKRSRLIGGPMKFKSYSLFLMVVYFLQTRSNPILPTIEDLFIKAEFQENPNNWSYDISQYIEKFPLSNNASDIETSLREFFFFYSNFDFSSIICTMNTKLIDAKSYASEDPQFELNTISIQDPFDCSQNVTTGVNWKYCKKLIRSLLATSEVYHKYSQNFTADKNWGIAAILDIALTEYSSETDEKSVEVEIPLKNYQFFQNDSACYLNIASEKVYSILKNVLFFQCNNLEFNAVLPEISKVDDVNSKYRVKNVEISKKEKEFADDSEIFLISKVLCTTANTWSGRSNYSSQNVQGEENDFLEYERKISRKILENKLIKEKEAFNFVCECYGTYKENIPYLYVNMISLNDKAFIPKLRIFLKEYILNYSRTYL